MMQNILEKFTFHESPTPGLVHYKGSHPGADLVARTSTPVDVLNDYIKKQDWKSILKAFRTFRIDLVVLDLASRGRTSSVFRDGPQLAKCYTVKEWRQLVHHLENKGQVEVANTISDQIEHHGYRVNEKPLVGLCSDYGEVAFLGAVRIGLHTRSWIGGL